MTRLILFVCRVVIHIVSEVSDAEKFEMLEKYVQVSENSDGWVKGKVWGEGYVGAKVVHIFIAMVSYFGFK